MIAASGIIEKAPELKGNASNAAGESEEIGRLFDKEGRVAEATRQALAL